MKNKSAYILSALVLLPVFIFNPWGHTTFDLPKIEYFAIFASIIIIFTALHSIYKGKFEIRRNKYVWGLLLLWLTSLVVSTIFSMSPNLSLWGGYIRFQGLFYQIIYIVYFIFFLHFFKEKKILEILLKTLVIIASITGIHALLQQFGIGEFSKEIINTLEMKGRSFATMGHPNFLGQFLVLPIFAAIYFALTKKGNKKKLSVASIIILVLALLSTQNRASILGVLVGAFFLIVFTAKFKKIYKILISGGLLVGVSSFIYFFAPTLRSLETRFYIWKGALQTFTDSPFIGSGLETFIQSFQVHAPVELMEVEKYYVLVDRAHNEYLDILVMQGMLGLAIYLATIIGLFYLIFKSNFRKNLILQLTTAAFIAILVANFFGFSMAIHSVLMMAIIAIILNQTIKFKTIKLKQNIFTIFISGILVAISILMIINAGKTIYADTKFLNGIKKIDQLQLEEGLINLAEANALNPHQSSIHFALVDRLVPLGFVEVAEDFLEGAGRFLNYDYRYHLAKGKIYFALGEYNLAEEHYKKAEEQAPIHPYIQEAIEELETAE